MTRQWLREWRMAIGNGSSATVIDNGPDASGGLRVRFEVSKATVQAPAFADITITNPSMETATKVQKEYNTVALYAGYEGNSAEIFSGEIVQKRGPGRENPTDTYLNVLAKDNQKAYSFAFISKSLKSGHTFRDQVDACLEALKPYGVTAGYIADLGSAKMPRGVAMFGSVREQLRTICASVGASWRIEGGKLNIVRDTGSLPGNAIVINSQTGMIGMPVQTIDGIEVQCLLNPRLRVDGLLKIDEASIVRQKFAIDNQDSYKLQESILKRHIATDGIYRILHLIHRGDTRGTDWYSFMLCTAASNNGAITTAGGMRFVPPPSPGPQE